ncbi:MAG TPA: MATE family efflux transporter [Vitreimonas sp.]|uniref:MATE family efflux transporter n=1 Tax=Vitreimonas sp. TaxID=3069702 RepID=UPI002D502238|nr:MATE family efflux transporter [Vitreimonas sp.]HYD86809.1 MATE family efflux transporter [Vitreimonas sp.]
MAASRPYVADLLRLAGPVALARLGIIGMAIVDVVVVGQLAPDELPHQALGWAPTAVFLVAAIGLLQGVQVWAARSLGEKNPEGAGVALRRGLVLAFVAGLVSMAAMWLAGINLFTVFGIDQDLAAPSTPVMRILALSIPLHLLYIAGTYFLEAIKKPGVSTAVMWGANVVNLALNLWWVPEHGAIGSAWATVGARVFLAGALLACIFLLRDGAHYGVRKLGAPGPSYRALLAVGIAAAVSQAVEAGAFSAMTVIAGRLGADVVAAYQILLNLMAFVFMLALGLAAATAVLVSEAVGRTAPHDAARAGWTGIGLNAIAMIIAAIVILLFSEQIARAYTADLVLAGLIASLMWITAIVLHPDGAQVVTASALRARGDNWFPTFSHIAAYAVVMPVLGYWLAEVEGQGVAGLLFAIFWSSVLSAAVLLMRWWALARSEVRNQKPEVGSAATRRAAAPNSSDF